MTQEGLDLGRTLRGLRRKADLSQRELAARAGVPQVAVSRIESGRTSNPSFRTVERLVRAAGDVLGVGGAAPAPIPHEALRDRADRHYPAHLDIEEVTRPEKWWGAWWTLTMIRAQWPLEQVPPYTFDLRRSARDSRRERAARGARARIRPVTATGLGGALWAWVAETQDEAETVRVGELRAHRERRGAVVMDGVVVIPPWRGCGVGRRLVEALRATADGAPVTALAGTEAEARFLEACGFRFAGAGASRWVG